MDVLGKDKLHIWQKFLGVLGKESKKWKLWLGPASSDSSHFSISDYKLKGNFWKVSPPLKHSHRTFDINAMATRIRRDHCIFMWRCQSVYDNRLRVQYRSTHILSYNHHQVQFGAAEEWHVVCELLSAESAATWLHQPQHAGPTPLLDRVLPSCRCLPSSG